MSRSIEEIAAWFQAYAEMAFLCYGIPLGDSIIVTPEQDAFLCQAANEYIADQKEIQS